MEFTEEERALLTPYNAAAHDYMRMEASKKDSVAPCWLCCSEEAREEARQGILGNFRIASKNPALTLRGAEDMAEWIFPAEIVESWREAELEMKQLRAEGNPRAYFAG